MLPRPTIEAFDIVVGGSALVLLGVIARQTRDVDILHPELSLEIMGAARGFAEQTRRGGFELGDDWLNNGPIQLGDVLPAGWRLRVQPAFLGRALILTALGRADLLKTKLFALCDRGTDLGDCVALAPAADELDEAEPWLTKQDTNPQWPDHVRATLADLRRRLGHGV